jgi:hypothetical protein
MSNPNGYNRRSTGPGRHHAFFTILIQTFNFPQKVIGHEWTFFEGAGHEAKSEKKVKNDDEEYMHYCISSDDEF